MNKTIPLGTVKLFFVCFGRVGFFPVWWYTRGLSSVLGFSGRSIRNQYENLGLDVWLKNLFVPMYGINDWAGRAISLLIRLFMVAVRGFGLLFFVLVFLVFVAAYLILLPVSIVGFIYHLPGVLTL
jgi:hypothetical protein